MDKRTKTTRRVAALGAQSSKGSGTKIAQPSQLNKQAAANQTDGKQTAGTQTDAKQTEGKQTDAGQADTKAAESKQADTGKNQGGAQNDAGKGKGKSKH